MTKHTASQNHEDEPTEAMNLPDSHTKASSEPLHASPAHDAESTFEVAGKAKPAREKTAAAEDPAPEQDALFEVEEVSKGNACDDEPTVDEQEIGKKEPSMDAKKIEDLTDRLAAANDKYLRLMAEFDNFKRRSAKEYERLVEAANERLMKDITEVRENFERAFKSNAEGDKLLEGMRLIFSKLNAILEKHGLEVYAEAGQKFDPGVHDALMRMPHGDIAEDHIVEVHERGYKLKGTIIKHAKVVVSSGKPPQQESDDEATIEIK